MVLSSGDSLPPNKMGGTPGKATRPRMTKREEDAQGPGLSQNIIELVM